MKIDSKTLIVISIEDVWNNTNSLQTNIIDIREDIEHLVEYNAFINNLSEENRIDYNDWLELLSSKNVLEGIKYHKSFYDSEDNLEFSINILIPLKRKK